MIGGFLCCAGLNGLQHIVLKKTGALASQELPSVFKTGGLTYNPF